MALANRLADTQNRVSEAFFRARTGKNVYEYQKSDNRYTMAPWLCPGSASAGRRGLLGPSGQQQSGASAGRPSEAKGGRTEILLFIGRIVSAGADRVFSRHIIYRSVSVCAERDALCPSRIACSSTKKGRVSAARRSV